MEKELTKKVVTIIGGASKFGKTPDRDQIVCEKLGVLLAESKSFDFVIQTGGTGGYPAFVTQAFGRRLLELKKPLKGRIFHFVPYKSLSITKGLFGETIGCAETMKQRREVLMKLPADVVLAISGGPGTANEMNWANKNKKRLISYVGSGGAAAGLIEDEEGTIPKISEECIKNKLLSSEDVAEDTDKIAEVIFELIMQT